MGMSASKLRLLPRVSADFDVCARFAERRPRDMCDNSLTIPRGTFHIWINFAPELLSPSLEAFDFSPHRIFLGRPSFGTTRSTKTSSATAPFMSSSGNMGRRIVCAPFMTLASDPNGVLSGTETGTVETSVKRFGLRSGNKSVSSRCTSSRTGAEVIVKMGHLVCRGMKKRRSLCAEKTEWRDVMDEYLTPLDFEGPTKLVAPFPETVTLIAE